MNTHEVSARIGLCLPRLEEFLRRSSAPIRDLTLDSMDTVELLCVIHQEFGVRLTEAEFHPAQTIEGLLHVISQKTIL